jgi:hypothetical protein
MVIGLPSSGNEIEVRSLCRETSDVRSLVSSAAGLEAAAAESTVEEGSFGAECVGASTPIVSGEKKQSETGECQQ